MAYKASMQKSKVISSDTVSVERLCQQLLAEVTAGDFNAEDTFAIHLAIEEAFLNAAQHGNQQDKTKKINVEYLITPDKFDISIFDEGNGFDPEKVPDPRCTENLYKSSGRGLLLMRSYMDIVEYNKEGNGVHMIKYTTTAKTMGKG